MVEVVWNRENWENQTPWAWLVLYGLNLRKVASLCVSMISFNMLVMLRSIAAHPKLQAPTQFNTRNQIRSPLFHIMYVRTSAMIAFDHMQNPSNGNWIYKIWRMLKLKERLALTSVYRITLQSTTQRQLMNTPQLARNNTKAILNWSAKSKATGTS